MSGIPKNTKPSGCATTSSNCVVWQGPSIPFLNLCNGDTVSDVVAGIADKICKIMEQLSPKNLDFSCLDLTDCPPETFNELFQIIIDEICEIKNTTTAPVTAESLADVEVGVATCLQGLAGGSFVSIDTMVGVLGQYVCNQTATIANLNATIANLTSKVSNLESTVNSITGV
ncbi:MAG: hypothetical protein RIR01_2386 [Bacteroidota bacterium]|jgi:hypothetical protein